MRRAKSIQVTVRLDFYPVDIEIFLEKRSSACLSNCYRSTGDRTDMQCPKSSTAIIPSACDKVLMSEVVSSRILVKNATLWRWAGVPTELSKAGSALPCSWFSIANGVICDISSNADSQHRDHLPEERFSQVIDARHRLVIPGLHDAHIHVSMTGESSYFLDLKGCESIDGLISTLSDHGKKFPLGVLPWIQGVNWDQVRGDRYVLSYGSLICLSYRFLEKYL